MKLLKEMTKSGKKCSFDSEQSIKCATQPKKTIYAQISKKLNFNIEFFHLAI